MVLPMHRMCAWLHVGKVFAHKSILPYILYSQGQSRNKPWKGQYPIDRLRSLFHIGTQIIPCLWHLGFIQIDFVWDVLVFHSHYLQIKINVVYVSLIRSVTSAPSFDAIVWLITLYSHPRNTGKLHWFLFWARDFENKKRPWQNIAICQGRITYKYKEYDTIRGAALIHRNAPMHLAGYQHIPGNWRMPTRCRILGVNRRFQKNQNIFMEGRWESA